MDSEHYFQKGLRMIVAGVIILALIIVFYAMIARGFPLWLTLVLLIPAGFCLVGLCFFSYGSSADISEKFFGRFQPKKPVKEKISAIEAMESTLIVESSPEKAEDLSALTSVPVPPVPESQTLKNALATVYEYTDRELGSAIDEKNRKILQQRLLYLACMKPVPEEVSQVRIDREKANYIDLCHYGWNIWNAFKGATNRFYDQTQLVEWLRGSFDSLASYNKKTLRAKLRATDGVSYRIRLIWNLKEYLQK